MKHLVKTVSLMCLLIFSEANAQKIDVKYTPIRASEDQARVTFSVAKEYSSSDNEFTYTRNLKDDDRWTIFITKTKKSNQKIIWEKEYVLDRFKKDKIIICDFVKTSTGFIFFIQKKIPKTRGNMLIAKILDENLKENADEVIVYESKKESLGYTIQKNGNYYLADCINDKNAHVNVLIDDKLNTISTQNIDLSKYKYPSQQICTLLPNGNITSVYRVSKNAKEKYDSDANWSFLVMNYSRENDQTKSEIISWGDKFKYYFSETIKFDTATNMISLYGTYHRTKKDKGSEGIFQIEFNASEMKTTVNNIIPFSKDILNRMVTEKRASKGDLPEYQTISNKINQENGDVLFILEEYIMTRSTNQGTTTGMQTTTINCNNINAIKVDKKGDILWSYVIEKGSNTSVNDAYITHFSFIYNNILYILFNASEFSAKNPEKNEGYEFEYRVGYESANVVVMAIDDKGTLLKTELLAQKQSKTQICEIAATKLIDENKFVLTFKTPTGQTKCKFINEGILTVE